MNNNDMFYNIFRINSNFLNNLTDLTIYEQVHYLYKYSDLNEQHLTGAAISTFLTCYLKQEDLILLFKLIDCSRIDINIVSGLLRGAYPYNHLILNDYRRIRDFYIPLTKNYKKIFYGLLDI